MVTLGRWKVIHLIRVEVTLGWVGIGVPDVIEIERVVDLSWCKHRHGWVEESWIAWVGSISRWYLVVSGSWISIRLQVDVW